MNRSIYSLTFLVLISLSVVAPQSVNVNCDFQKDEFSQYVCVLEGVTIADDQNANIVIGGNHLPGLKNEDVIKVEIINTSIPFIITQFFTTFPNVIEFFISNSGLTRVQTGAFANARSLIIIRIQENPTFRQIHANAFTGALNVQSLMLHNNNIDSIHGTAFDGLSSLSALYLTRNQNRHLSKDLLRPLKSLRWFFAGSNQLEFIDGNLFELNYEIVQIDFNDNRINAIGRNLLNGKRALSSFSIKQNICVNDGWTTSQTQDFIERVHEGLSVCYANAE